MRTGSIPVFLAEAGLAAALASLAEQAPVRVEVDPAASLPADVEVVAYFLCSEALANVAKLRFRGHDLRPPGAGE